VITSGEAPEKSKRNGFADSFRFSAPAVAGPLHGRNKVFAGGAVPSYAAHTAAMPAMNSGVPAGVEHADQLREPFHKIVVV